MGKKEESQSQQFIAIDQSRQKEHSKKFKKLKKKKKDEGFAPNNPGVIFLSHIPAGFAEPQMKSYFEQFGDVIRLKLSRSIKTGNPKGYAYIEFAHKEVAEIVAEAMNGYLMFERILKCEVVPYDKLHKDTFKGANRHFKKPFQRKTSIKRLNAPKSEKAMKFRLKRVEKSNSRLAERLKSLGIDYDLKKVRVDDLKSEDIVLPAKVKKDKQQKQQIGETSQVADSTLNSTKGEYFLIDEDDDEITFKIPPESASRVRYLARTSPDEASKPEFNLNEETTEK